MKTSSPKSLPSEADDKTVALIDSIAAQVRADIEAGKLPDIRFPVRSLDNVIYDKAKGLFRAWRCRERSDADGDDRKILRADPAPDGDLARNGRTR